MLLSWKVSHPEPNVWRLNISQVEMRDAGWYTCQVSQVSGESRCQVSQVLGESEALDSLHTDSVLQGWGGLGSKSNKEPVPECCRSPACCTWFRHIFWDCWIGRFWSIEYPGILILCSYQGMTLVAEQVVREVRDAAPISAKTSNFLSVTQFNIVMIKSLLKF